MQRKIVERLTDTCPTCDGNGNTMDARGHRFMPCWRCHQRGWVTCEERDVTAEHDAAMAELAWLRVENDALRADDVMIRGALDTIRRWYEAVEEGR